MSLEQLKKIRSQRVERLYTELQRFKSFFKQAELKLQQARIELDDYCLWRGKQEKSLFENLQSGSFSLDKIKSYNLNLDKLKEQETKLREGIPAFKDKVAVARKELDKAREKLQHANKDMEKVDEFINIQNEEDTLIEEKQEENVADELSCFNSSQV